MIPRDVDVVFDCRGLLGTVALEADLMWSAAKYLGINTQDNLSWGLHIDTITNKANKILGFLRRNLKIGN